VSEAHHDVVVIGASAGGVEALQRLMASIDDQLHAAFFVVLHLPTNAHSFLPKILSRTGCMPVQHAEHGLAPQPGHVYVAPPDSHLLLKHGAMHLLRGPTENGHRPAIDPLFRSAAESHGSRVIGIVLSGVLDDGTNGLLAIASHGGLTVAQDPDDALYPSMPKSAIDTVPVDMVAPADEIGRALHRLIRHPVAPLTLTESDGEDYTERALEGGGALEMLGRPSRFTCPDCGGSLWDGHPDEPGKFRCRVGHSWTAHGLLDQQAVLLDQALWTALRALSERADLVRRMRDKATAAGHGYGARMYERQLEEYEAKAQVVRDVLRSPEPMIALEPDLLPSIGTAAEISAVGPPDELPASS
jgi:two-component system chemotaxis response regulator CheB